MVENNGKVLLKKTKSSHNIESYYYTGEESNPEKQIKFDFYKVRQWCYSRPKLKLFILSTN